MGEITSIHGPDLAALTSTTDQLSTALDSIEDHHWSLATPCTDWDVAALVDHVTGGNWFTIRILAGNSADEAMADTMKQFGGNGVTREEAVSSVNDQLIAFSQPGVLDRHWNHVAGDLTGAQVLRLRLHDLIIHTWDIEQTLDPPAALPSALVRWGLGELADDESLTSKHFELASTPGPDASRDPGAVYLSSFGRYYT